MATLKCEVVELEIHEHPNADAIEIAQVRGYQSIVKKGQFKTGDLAVYIPEQSVVPPWVLRRLGMWDEEKGKGGLAGSKGDRVKAIKLRQVLSQGLLLPLNNRYNPDEADSSKEFYWSLSDKNGLTETVVELGQDVTDILDVTKYEPPVPVHMSGEVVNVHGKTLKYDIENIKNYPAVAQALQTFGIKCSITEKLHGCVHRDTMITLVDGTRKSIHEIVNNKNITEILSYDIKNDNFIPRKITGKMVRANTEKKKWMILTMENGESLRITEDHPVFSKDRNKFISAKDIKMGENIKSIE